MLTAMMLQMEVHRRATAGDRVGMGMGDVYSLPTNHRCNAAPAPIGNKVMFIPARSSRSTRTLKAYGTLFLRYQVHIPCAK